jgi:hypothetical protein
MSTIERLGVRPQEILSAPTEIRFRSLEEKMKVIGHLNGRVDLPPEPIDGFFTAREELDSVIVTQKDVRTLHATAHQMIDGVGILNSKSAVGVRVIHARMFRPSLQSSNA